MQKEVNKTERHAGIQLETVEAGATSVQCIPHTPEQTKVDQQASRSEKDNSEDKEEVGHSSTNTFKLWANPKSMGNVDYKPNELK